MYCLIEIHPKKWMSLKEFKKKHFSRIIYKSEFLSAEKMGILDFRF
jgi:hypothetical protein